MGFVPEQSNWQPPTFLSGLCSNPEYCSATQWLDRVTLNGPWQCARCHERYRHGGQLACWRCGSLRPGPFDEDGATLPVAIAWTPLRGPRHSIEFAVSVRAGKTIATRLVEIRGATSRVPNWKLELFASALRLRAIREALAEAVWGERARLDRLADELAVRMAWTEDELARMRVALGLAQ